MKQTNFFAYALILIGSALLLYQFHIISLTWSEVVIAGSLLLGIIWLRKAAMHPKRHGLFGGTFWLLTGLVLLLMYQNVIPRDDAFGFGLLLLILAFANLVHFTFVRKAVNNITSAIFLILVASAFFVVYFNYISRWELLDLVYVYWPILLIIGGIALVVEGVVKRA